MLDNMIHAIRRLLFGRHLYRTLMRAGVLGMLCVALCKYVLRPAWISGSSMEPTIRDGRLHFIYLLAYRTHPPERGDIISAFSATQSLMYLKRVVGLPGERIAFADGVLFVNDQSVEEPYVVYQGAWSMPPVELGDDEYFVTGDNRDMDRLAHTHGIVHARSIAGKLFP